MELLFKRFTSLVPNVCNTVGHKRPQNIQNFVLKSGIDKRYNNKPNHWKTF